MAKLARVSINVTTTPSTPLSTTTCRNDDRHNWLQGTFRNLLCQAQANNLAAAVLGLLWVLSTELVTCKVCLVATTPASIFWNLADLFNTNSLNSSLVTRSSALMSVCVNWRGKSYLDNFPVFSQVRNALNRTVSSGRR